MLPDTIIRFPDKEAEKDEAGDKITKGNSKQETVLNR